MKKRIAFVINSLSGGGAEKTVSNLSRALCGRYAIDIIVNDDRHIDYSYEGRIISLRMPPEAERMGTIYQLLALVRRTVLLRDLKKRRNYAAVISFSEMTNAANVLSGNRHTKTVVSVRNAVDKRKKRGIRQKLVFSLVLPLICRKADLTVSCSQEIADDLIRHYGLPQRRSRVIYNGLDLPRIREEASVRISDAEGTGSAGTKRIVAVGRMTHQKGQWHLLKAAKKLCDDGIPVQLIILGDGELRPFLEDLTAKLGILDHVSMPGFVGNPYPYLVLADVFVMPSLYEGFSNAVLEALACGVPVISTDHETGAREILAPDTDYAKKVTDRIDFCAYGLLVPVCSGNSTDPTERFSREEELMADAIGMILRDDRLAARYRQASLIRAEQLNLASVCQQWITVIEEG